MDGWIERGMDERKNGWMDLRRDGEMNYCMDDE